MRARGYNERVLERPWDYNEIDPSVNCSLKTGGKMGRGHCLKNQNICEAQIRTELPARGSSARYAREFSFAKCHGEAD